MLTYIANAKINLMLDIVGRRDDGYHLLSMIMQSVSLHDVITVEKTATDDLTLSCNDATVPCDDRNLIIKAAKVFFAESGIKFEGLHFNLTKNIPSQAGLGGGSADAAATLRALNRLYAFPLSDEKLLAIALRLGADVPFCLLGGTYLAEGIGEILSPLPSMADCGIVIVKPPFGSSTVEAYRLADTCSFPHPSAKPVADALASGDLPALSDSLGNAFQSILANSEIERICADLKTFGALGSSMTGSGTAVYGIFPTFETAAACAEILSGKGEKCFVCSPVTSGWEELTD